MPLAEWGPRLALAGVKALWEAGQVVRGAPEFLVSLVPSPPSGGLAQMPSRGGDA